jgi:hypothetical protein
VSRSQRQRERRAPELCRAGLLATSMPYVCVPNEKKVQSESGYLKRLFTVEIHLNIIYYNTS